MSLCLSVFCLSTFISTLSTQADEKKDDKKKDTPTVTCITPFALIPGKAKSITIRGLALADAASIKLTDASNTLIPAAIKSKGKSEPPKPFEAPRAGDTELQADLTLPADLKPQELSLVIVTPAGETKSFPLQVADPAAAIEEKEPNNGFKTAQELPLGTTVIGTIQDASDVDVFRIGGRAGMKIVVEITAERRGSLLDGLLTLYDAAGHVLATADDSDNSHDPILRATLPSDGIYYLSLVDANEKGSPAHAYELIVREDK